MNTARVIEASRRIEERRLALKWLNDYGTQIDGRNKDAASVAVHLNYASACAGAKEAQAVLSAYAQLNLPEVVRSAIECCRNDIIISLDAIRDEINSDND